MKKLFFFLSAIAALILTSCSDEGSPIDNILPQEAKTVLILNEGGFNQNNSTLSTYDLSTGTYNRDYFNSVNHRGLGDVGNDMILYGSKLYIVMNVSGTIEIVDSSTGTSLKQIEMKNDDDTSIQPRQIASYNGKVYVTSYDDTVTRIDTTSLNIDATLQVGLDPDGIVANNGKLYVANSGGLNYMGGYNNTLSIIDVASFEVIDEIEVGLNPTNLDIDNKGNVYISSLGNYFDTPAAFQKFDPVSKAVTTIEEISNPVKFLIHDNKAYIVQGSYGNPYNVLVYDCITEKVIVNNFITDGTQIEIIHSLSVDENTGDIFIMESDYSVPGSVYCFDKNGKLKYSIDAIGLNPNSVVVL